MSGSLFEFTVSGEREVTRTFEGFTPELQGELKAVITEIIDRLYGQIEGQVPKRTGRLAGELTHHVRETKDEITGSVSVSGEFAKAAALEYGAHGNAQVRAHPMHLTQMFGTLLAAPMIVTVEAFTRHMNIAEHRFLRGPFAQDEAQIEQQLERAVQSATDKANA